MKIAILGAGQQARGALFYLIDKNIEKIVIADHDEQALRNLIKPYLPDNRIVIKHCDANRVTSLLDVLEGCDTAVSCLPYEFNVKATRAAIEAKCNLVDLGGNNDIVKQQFEYDAAAKQAGVTIIPDCGLAPGFVSLLVSDAIADNPVDNVSIYVGGLPNETTAKAGMGGPLNYAKVFSIKGLLNEYVEPVEVIQEGEIKEVPALSGLHKVTAFSDVELEAFRTSGGASTLPSSYQGVIKRLEYYTLRYPGHHSVLTALQQIDALTEENLDKLIPTTKSDVVFGRVVAIGYKGHKKYLKTYEFIVRPDFSPDYKTTISAMAQATAYPATLIAMMLPTTSPGVSRQEDSINTKEFIEQLNKDIKLTIKNTIIENEI